MFTPDLDLKVITRCSKFSVLDKTGPDTGDGTKWYSGTGSAGLDPDTLSSVVLRIVNPSGQYNDYEVKAQVPRPVTDEWYFSDITGTQVDGLHNIIYRLKLTTTKSISAFSNYGSTVYGTVKVTSATHGLITGMYAIITGTTNYNGEYYVTKIDDNNFYITHAWVSNDATGTITKMYSSIFYPYVYCRSEAGVDKMFANLSRLVPSESRKKYEDDALTAWGLLQALKSAISSSNVTAMTNLQAEIDQILSFNEVDPNL